jgi:nitrile hydratase
MNGVHDMGGMHGFGPIEREIDEPVFHADWEPHVLAMNRLLMARGYYTLDAFRHGIERMAPAEYLRAPYYERWLTSVQTLVIELGAVTPDELAARIDLLRRDPDAVPRQTARESLPPPSPVPSPPPPAPRFAVGDDVVTRNVHDTGHTRLPRYARGKRGVIHHYYGPQPLPDTNAHGLGERPEPLYSVRFEARELWGDSAEPRQTVSISLWDSYLDPVSD